METKQYMDFLNRLKAEIMVIKRLKARVPEDDVKVKQAVALVEGWLLNRYMVAIKKGKSLLPEQPNIPSPRENKEAESKDLKTLKADLEGFIEEMKR